jgi:hypothetical protein
MIGPGGFMASPKPKKPLTDAQKRQRAVYNSHFYGKRDEKRLSEIDALKRATGKGG